MTNSIIGKSGVNDTKSTKKVSFGGVLKEFQVFRVNLKHLFYNDKNDRIVTSISQYIEENQELNKNEIEVYNKIIEKFIINSNKTAFIKTKNNIAAIGQREPGVILNDGRVIDGNRRFTCLRQLFEETKNQEFEFFETIIVNGDIGDKEIKILELDLQHGIDEKVDYNPIDKLVGIYKDIIKNKILTEEEYAKHINVTKSKMKVLIEKANIMVDFLDFIKSNEKFHIARDFELDGPLQEISRIKNRYKTEEEWDNVKPILYSYMFSKPKGDVTRVIRDIGAILKSKKAEEFIEKNEEIAEKIYDAIPEEEKSANSLREVRKNNKNLIEEMSDNLDDYKDKANLENIVEKPIKTIQKAQNILNEVDNNIVNLLSYNEKIAIKKALNKINNKIHELEVAINVE